VAYFLAKIAGLLAFISVKRPRGVRVTCIGLPSVP
jgi:hypothetical protein